MRLRSDIRLAVLAAALIGVLVGGCGDGTPSSSSVDLRIAVAELPVRLNPLLARTFEERLVTDLIFDGMFNRSGASTEGVEPGVALSIEQASGTDTHIYFARLDDGSKWHDSGASVGGGCDRQRSAPEHAVSVEDILFTWRCLSNRTNRSPLAPRVGAMISGIERERSSRGDVRIEFVRPIYIGWAQEELAYFKIVPQTMFGAPLTEDLINNEHAQEFNECPVGTGPYMFAGRSGNSLFLSSVARRSIGTIEFREVADRRKQARYLLDGELDLCFDLPLDLHNDLVAGGVEFREYLPYAFYAVAINTRHSRLREPSVRRALSQAVDRNAILAELLPPGANPDNYAMWSPYPANADPILRRLQDLSPHDPASARATLDEYGLKEQSINLRYPDLLGETARLIAERIAAAWRECGLSVTITPVGVAFDQALRTGNFETALILEDGFDKHYSIESLYTPNGLDNYTGVQSERLDTLLGELRGAVTVMQKFPKCQELNRVLAADPGYVYLFTLPSRLYFANRLHGVDVLDPNAPLATLEHWRLDS